MSKVLTFGFGISKETSMALIGIVSIYWQWGDLPKNKKPELDPNLKGLLRPGLINQTFGHQKTQT